MKKTQNKWWLIQFLFRIKNPFALYQIWNHLSTHAIWGWVSLRIHILLLHAQHYFHDSKWCLRKKSNGIKIFNNRFGLFDHNWNFMHDSNQSLQFILTKWITNVLNSMIFVNITGKKMAPKIFVCTCMLE